jgi:ribose transport system substrate-binding protein
MKPFRVMGWLAVALALGLSPACGPASGKSKVAFVSNNVDPFWSIARAGADKAAGEGGVDLVFRMPDPGDAATQKENIDTVLNQGVKAIAVSVTDPSNQTPYFTRDVVARVPLITQDNDAPASGRICYIGTDNYEAGKAAGRLVKEAMPDGGVVAIFVGNLSALNAQQRRKGVLDELAGKQDAVGEDVTVGDKKFKQFGKYRLSGPAPDYTYLDMPEKETKCLSNAQDALTSLQKEKDICLVGLWAYEPPQLLTAAGNNTSVRIVAFDEAPGTLDGVASDRIYGTIVQNPYEFGYKSVKIMAALAKGDDKQKAIDSVKGDDVDIVGDQVLQKFRIVTKEGHKDYDQTAHGVKTTIPVKEFRDDLSKMLGKPW